ncbi:hypothetical protein J6590_079878 [Homalodisca vitripennis]|nr:hypothetical protein J6590_093307 [Homalodisca vitripennis]KAG8315014.1 hypothetical protein J6590_079878 [Homalodisca vitripennis]
MQNLLLGLRTPLSSFQESNDTSFSQPCRDLSFTVNTICMLFLRSYTGHKLTRYPRRIRPSYLSTSTILASESESSTSDAFITVMYGKSQESCPPYGLLGYLEDFLPVS